ncbi:hypothetical protein J7E85_31180 [Paenibacillus sp. ISL-20]|nr:hypothetical protein [Paenibacillus sp. ISL-20]
MLKNLTEAGISLNVIMYEDRSRNTLENVLFAKEVFNFNAIESLLNKARHWFVTSMLRGIYEQSDTAAQIEDKKKQLIEYMKWRDPETLNVYEHYYDEQKFRDLHEKLQESYMQREKEYFKTAKKRSVIKSPEKLTAFELKSSEEKQDWLNEFFEGMEP